MLTEFMRHGHGEQDATAQQLHDELMTLLGYDRQRPARPRSPGVCRGERCRGLR
jgi:hypothetical protein